MPINADASLSVAGVLDAAAAVFAAGAAAVLAAAAAAAACAHQVDDGHLVFTEGLMCGPLHARGEVYAPPTAGQQAVSTVPGWFKRGCST